MKTSFFRKIKTLLFKKPCFCIYQSKQMNQNVTKIRGFRGGFFCNLTNLHSFFFSLKKILILIFSPSLFPFCLVAPSKINLFWFFYYLLQCIFWKLFIKIIFLVLRNLFLVKKSRSTDLFLWHWTRDDTCPTEDFSRTPSLKP